MTVTFIGAGNMGGAIIRGMLRVGVCSAESLAIIEKSQSVKDSFSMIGVRAVESIGGAEDLVVVCVKPWQREEVASMLSGYNGIVCSVMAGVDLQELESLYGTKNVVRLMPNTAVEMGCGVTFIAGRDDLIEVAKPIFDKIGEVVVVGEEKFEAAMSVGSCGLAFALRYARASMVGAIELGLSAQEAQKIVAGVMGGAAAMLLNGEDHPEVLIDRITTPGGVTIKGLSAMEHSGFSSAVIEGLKAAKSK